MRMFNRPSLFRLLVDVGSPAEMDAVKARILELMRERHRADDVTVITQDALLSAFSSIMRALTLALAAIASVSLVVAGVGIMNVMLVSVAERRAEVGLLKALGARDRQVLSAFLAEATVLSVVGGLIGLGVGFAAIAAFRHLYPAFPAMPPGWAIVAALAMSALVGVGFGVWPARRGDAPRPGARAGATMSGTGGTPRAGDRTAPGSPDRRGAVPAWEFVRFVLGALEGTGCARSCRRSASRSVLRRSSC